MPRLVLQLTVEEYYNMRARKLEDVKVGDYHVYIDDEANTSKAQQVLANIIVPPGDIRKRLSEPIDIQIV